MISVSQSQTKTSPMWSTEYFFYQMFSYQTQTDDKLRILVNFYKLKFDKNMLGIVEVIDKILSKEKKTRNKMHSHAKCNSCSRRVLNFFISS